MHVFAEGYTQVPMIWSCPIYSLLRKSRLNASLPFYPTFRFTPLYPTWLSYKVKLMTRTNIHLSTYSLPVPWTDSSPPANKGLRSISPELSASVHLHVLPETNVQPTAEAICTWTHWNTAATSTKRSSLSMPASILKQHVIYRIFRKMHERDPL